MSERKDPKVERLDQLKQWWLLAENAFNPWFVQAKEDMDFYLGGEKLVKVVEKIVRRFHP